MQVSGKLYIDAGAAQAIKDGKSLLAAGLTGTRGEYQSGDCLEIVGPEEEHLAQGLVAWDAELVQQVIGLRSEEIENLLGVAMRTALVHRDNMAI